jgi:carbon-monoxide dehydrogenase small subunit
MELQTATVVVSLRVNGSATTATVDARTSLAHFLRDHLRLTGTRMGCDTAQCGACTVLLDGRSVKSCNMLLAQTDGMDVTTIEGLLDGHGRLHPLQECFRECHALQCGYCTSGMVMRCYELLGTADDLDDEALRGALEGNICRCTGYGSILVALKAALHRAQSESTASDSLPRGEHVRV